MVSVAGSDVSAGSVPDIAVRLPSGLDFGKPWVRSAVMGLLALMVALEFFENIMFVFAANHIVGGVGGGPRAFARLQAAYACGSLMMIVGQQWLARTYGYRVYLCVAAVVLATGLLLAAQAQNLDFLLLARVIQGLGAGAFFTSSRILILQLFQAAERGRAIRYFMYGIFGFSAAAPATAAVMVDAYQWQAVFYVLLPLALVVALGCWYLLPGTGTEVQRPRLPLGSVAWFGVCAVLLQWLLSEAQWDVFSQPWLFAGVGVLVCVLFLLFLYHQWQHHQPLLHVRPLLDPVYLTGLFLYGVYYYISNSLGYVLPVFAEQGLGVPLLNMGWLFSASGVVSLLGVALYLRLARRLQRKKALMVSGLLLMAGNTWAMSLLSPQTTLWQLLPFLLVKSVFAALVVIPVAGQTYQYVRESDFAHAYQSKNLLRQAMMTFATATAAILVHNRQIVLQSSLTANATARPDAAMRLTSIQDYFASQGLLPDAAQQAAVQLWAQWITHQALVIACLDVFRLLSWVCLCGVAVIVVQKYLH